MAVKKVAMLTAGGLAPCLSSAIAGLVERYTEIAPDVEIICYRAGYKGLLLGDSFTVTQEMRDKIAVLYQHGGSPIGNSRVKLTNVKDCVKRGLVQEGQDPQQVAADQLHQPLMIVHRHDPHRNSGIYLYARAHSDTRKYNLMNQICN